jgi:hypothetical protein
MQKNVKFDAQWRCAPELALQSARATQSDPSCTVRALLWRGQAAYAPILRMH